MSIKRIFSIFLRQLFLFKKNKARLFNILYWPILDLTLWGIITLYLDKVGNSGFSFVSVILGAVVLWNFLIRIIQGVTFPLLEDVWARNFLNLFSSPLKISEYILGLVSICIITSAVALAVMLLAAWLFFSYSIFEVGFMLLPFVLILFIFGVALGVLNTAIVLKLGPSAEWLAWTIPFFFSPFSGVFYPISALPQALQYIANFTPASYVFEGMRSVLLTGSLNIPQLLIGAGLAILYLIAAYFFLVYVYRTVLKNGLLARFTAELG